MTAGRTKKSSSTTAAASTPPVLDDQMLLHALRERPDFLERYPELLVDLSLPHAPSAGAVSLVERQVVVLKEKVRGLEQKIAGMVNHAQENRVIEARLMAWLRDLLMKPTLQARADDMVAALRKAFELPAVGLAVWSARASGNWRQPAGEELSKIADELVRPICLPASAHQARAALGLVSENCEGGSTAILPLRSGMSPKSLGLLVIASPDPGRFSSEHGTDFLERIAELASAALQPLANLENEGKSP